MNTDADRSALVRRAQTALALLEHQVRKNPFGDVEGVDTLNIGLDRLADALAALVNLPRNRETSLEDVLAHMSPDKVLDETTSDCIRTVREGIKRATYEGLSAKEIRKLDGSRDVLHRRLEALIGEDDGQEPDA